MRKITCLVLAMLLTLSLAACGGKTETTATTAAASSSTGVEDGVLTIAMECAYAPYNWTQGDDSNGAVPISNVPGSYASWRSSSLTGIPWCPASRPASLMPSSPVSP